MHWPHNLNRPFLCDVSFTFGVIWRQRSLHELKLPKAVMQEFIWDVFGNPALLQLGLVDAEDSSDLDRQFLQLEEI